MGKIKTSLIQIDSIENTELGREGKGDKLQGREARTLLGPNKPLGLLPGPTLLTRQLITNAMSSLGRAGGQASACLYTQHTIRHAAALQTMTQPGCMLTTMCSQPAKIRHVGKEGLAGLLQRPTHPVAACSTSTGHPRPTAC